MKIKAIFCCVAFALASGCGPGPNTKSVSSAPGAAQPTAASSSEFDSTGVISALEGMTITLDHEGASAANLPTGRDRFVVYADVLSEAPITPGARVAFRFHRTADGLELTELKAR